MQDGETEPRGRKHARRWELGWDSRYGDVSLVLSLGRYYFIAIELEIKVWGVQGPHPDDKVPSYRFSLSVWSAGEPSPTQVHLLEASADHVHRP